MRYLFVDGILHPVVFLNIIFILSVIPSTAGERLPAATGEYFEHREHEEGMPSHETEGFFSLGYRSLILRDSDKAYEYQYPHSSLAGQLDIASYPLPHRFHLTTEYLSEKNYYGDMGYAFSDLLLFRDTFLGVYRNIESYNYQFVGEPPSVTYDNRNVGDEYHTGMFDNIFFLRFKFPDFPFHAFLKHRYFAKEGSVQQRFLIGSLGDLQKVSQTRDIDWQSQAFTLGANSHLGPVEIEYSHDVTRFDPGRNNILYDFYPATSDRPADTYPHDVIPETESSANSLKVHSSYTGGLVAAATLSSITQKNSYSGIKSDTWRGATDLSYMPFPELYFSCKFRHQELEIDSPYSVNLKGLTNERNYIVRQSISSKSDVFVFSARYQPMQRVTLLSNYEFSSLERTNTDQWQILPEYTESNSIKLAAYARPVSSLNLKLSTDFRFVHNPALNIEPDYSNQVQFSTTYLPTTWITAFLSYNLAKTERDNVRYLNNTPNVIVDGGRRETNNDRLLASLSFVFSPKTTLTASFAQYNGKVEQDLAYAKWNDSGTAGDLPYLDFNVPYTDKAHSYSLSLHNVPIDSITVMTSVSYTVSQSEFAPRLAEAETPVSLGAFSTVKADETAFVFELTKALQNRWEVGIRFLSNYYNDRHDDSQDGRFYSSTCALKRHF